MSPRANTSTCECGQPKKIGQLQCDACRKAAMAKLVKIAAALGVLLGLVCSSLPEKYQAPCKAVAGILSAC